MSLKGLAKLKREGRTSLHAVQYKWQSTLTSRVVNLTDVLNLKYLYSIFNK